MTQQLLPGGLAAAGNRLLAAVDGNKTYASAAVLGLVALLDVGGLIPAAAPQAVYAAAAAAAAASLRHALSKLPPETISKLDRVGELLDKIRDQFPPVPPAA